MYDYADSVPLYAEWRSTWPIEEIDIDDEAAAHCFYNTLTGSTQEQIIAAFVRHVVQGAPLQISDLTAILNKRDIELMQSEYLDAQHQEADRREEEARREWDCAMRESTY